VRPDRRDHNDVRAFTKNWQELLNQEERTSDVCHKEVVKILRRVICDARRLADSGIEHKDIQSIADD